MPILALLWLLRDAFSATSVGSLPPAPGTPASALPNPLTLITQLMVILATARVVGWLFRRVGQPQVVGEMTAGILLGPSILGALWPAGFEIVFPAPSLGYLNALSQLGVLLFMFLVGLEFDAKLLRGRGHTAVVTSHASIILPLVLGAWLGTWLHKDYAPPGVGVGEFAIFLGAAMCVTAFPVLARILRETGLANTRVGMVTLACAAVDDVTAWCLLAVVIIVVRANPGGTPLLVTLGGTLIYVALMLLVARPLLRRAFDLLRHPSRVTQDVIAALLFFALFSALATERIGIHALFGAFLAGAVVPRNEGFVPDLVHRLDDLTVVFLLPLFFAFTGLRTSLNLVQLESLGVLALIITVAVSGKLVGSALAARLTGMRWREALAVGTLMNTRGLMELIILNIGLDIGVLSSSLFSMMVAMAVITTIMTTPLLRALKLRAPELPARSAERP